MPNTALAFLLSGAAVWLVAGRPAGPRLWLSRAAAAAAGALGLLNLAEYALGTDLGIDELLFRDPAGLTASFPGRMAPATALSFAAIAASVLVSNWKRSGWLGDGLALIPGILGLVSLAGYSYRLQGFYWIGVYKRMAIPAALAFLVLSVGLLLLRSDVGFGRVIRSDTAGGALARRIFPVAIAVPLLLGWLGGLLQRAGLLAPEFQGALIAVADGVVLFAVLWAVAERLRQADEEEKRTLEALESSERRFRELVARAPIGIYRSTVEGRFASVNAAYAKILGYDSQEEVLGLDLRADLYFEGGERERLLAENERGGGVSSSEAQLKRKDGSPVWVRLVARAVRDESGRTTHFEGFVHDIGERKRVEKALQREMLFSDTAIASLPGVFYLLDSKGRFLRWNENLERVSGYSGEEIGRMNALDFFAGEDKRQIAERIDEVFVRGEATAEASLVSRSGQAIPFFFTGRRMRAGEEAFLVGVGIDRAAVRALEQRYQVLMENAGDAIFIVSPDGRILEANRAAEQLRGDTREALIGLTIPDLLPADERPAAQQHFQRMLAGGSTRDEHRHILRADGERVPIEVSASPVEIGGDRVAIAIVRDVSERFRLERQLQQSQKMEAVGQLAGGIAHDFNNLLTAILGYADLLANEAGKASPLLESIGEIRKAGERAAALTRQLLAFSRRQVLEPRVLDLNALVENLEKMLSRLIGEDVELATKLDAARGRVRADVGQIEQVIMNLAVNARDAMPGGGKLTIETKDVELDEAYAREHAVPVAPGSYVMLAVSDTGVGMSAETKSHMFEPFFTTKRRGKGTGLGLATVYGIVKQSGGYIWAYSELERGTTFKIYLPRVEGVAEKGSPRSTGLRPMEGSETVLLVEDEENVRTLARRILEASGYAVLEAGNGEAALETARRHAGPIHLLLTDVVMPEMGGSDLASRVESLRPDTKVLFMSGYTDDGVVRQGLVSKGRFFLQKPFSPEGLARKVREVLDRER